MPAGVKVLTQEVGHNAYYCADCLLSYENGGETEIFYIDAKGSCTMKDKEAALKLVESKGR